MLNSRTPGSCVYTVIGTGASYTLPNTNGVLFIVMGAAGGNAGAYIFQGSGASAILANSDLGISTSSGVHTIENNSSLGMRVVFIGII